MQNKRTEQCTATPACSKGKIRRANTMPHQLLNVCSFFIKTLTFVWYQQNIAKRFS